MKKVIFLMVFVFAFSTVQAQEVLFGAKAGLNLSNISFSENDLNDFTKSRISFHIGALAEINLSDNFSVQPEILFSSGGYKYEETEFYGYKTSGYNSINYLSLPILAKYYVSESFSIEAGPYFSLLLSSKNDITTTEISKEIDTFKSSDVKDWYTSSDYGIAVGVSYKLDAGLFLGTRFNYGLANIDNKDFIEETNNKNYGNDVVVRNVLYSFFVGYIITLN